MPRCCATTPLRADYKRRCASAAAARCANGCSRRSAKRVEFELADAAGVARATSVRRRRESGPSSRRSTHPARCCCDGAAWHAMRCASWRRRSAARARAQEAASGLALRSRRPSRRALRRAWAALFTRRRASRAAARRKGRAAGRAVQRGSRAARRAACRAARSAARASAHGRGWRALLLAEFAALKRARGWPTWPTWSAARSGMLRDGELSGWVQERLDARSRHVLIDEFQDTSPLQWQALHAWLVGYAGAGGGASGQRPPGVFIVGDPKQSIYRFRRAEPRVFEAARDVRARRPRRRRARAATTRGATRPRCSRRSTRCSRRRRRRGRLRGLSARTPPRWRRTGGAAVLRACPAIARPPRAASAPAAERGLARQPDDAARERRGGAARSARPTRRAGHRAS